MKLNRLNIGNSPMLTDGGFETDLIFNHGIDLPHFAAFPLLEKPQYQELIKNYYRSYLEIASKNGTGYILESGTWRANRDWGFKLGYTEADLDRVNRLAIKQLKELRVDYNERIEKLFISGCVGPRGDGYAIDEAMTVEAATAYHNDQISSYVASQVDLVTALTMNYSEEALGVVKAAQQHDCPVVISFTVETNGHLPNGESLEEAITRIDEETDGYPLYYMINCAHPSHFMHVLEDDKPWMSRIRGLRSNASEKCHQELDESTELDRGNPDVLGNWHQKLIHYLPELFVFGGCCGTDSEHIGAIIENVTVSGLT